MSTKISIKSCMFYAEVRTKDGLEYEPESLKSMLAALDRHLKDHDYKCSIMRDREFYQSKLGKSNTSSAAMKREEAQ